MKRYNEVLSYFNSENSIDMDIERYISIREHDMDRGLKRINGKDNALSSSGRFFKKNSESFLYLYGWKAFYRGLCDNDDLCSSIALNSMMLFCDYKKIVSILSPMTFFINKGFHYFC